MIYTFITILITIIFTKLYIKTLSFLWVFIEKIYHYFKTKLKTNEVDR